MIWDQEKILRIWIDAKRLPVDALQFRELKDQRFAACRLKFHHGPCLGRIIANFRNAAQAEIGVSHQLALAKI